MIHLIYVQNNAWLCRSWSLFIESANQGQNLINILLDVLELDDWYMGSCNQNYIYIYAWCRLRSGSRKPGAMVYKKEFRRTYPPPPPPHDNRKPEPEFVNILRSPGIDSQHGGQVRQPYLTYRPARLHRLAESTPWNRFLAFFFSGLVFEL